MPASQIRGSTQIMAGTITVALLAAGFLLPTAMLTDGALLVKSDGSVPFTQAVNFGGQRATNAGTPTAATDLATKGYVDSTTQGLDPKPAVRAMSAANIASKSGTTTIDGVTLAVNDRVLLTAQTTASENGIWVIQSGAWTRPPDYAAGSSTVVTDGAYVLVEQGTQYKGTGWIISTQGAITVDTTATVWQQFQGASATTAGNGITVTGNQVAVKNGNGITFDGSQAVTLNLNGSSLNLSASGVKIADATAPGQIMLGNASNAATFTTLSGDVASVSGTGVVALASGIRRTGSFVYFDTLTGAINGVNTNFTTSQAPATGTVMVFLNSILQHLGAGNDYTLSAGTITFNAAPVAGDRISVFYQV